MLRRSLLFALLAAGLLWVFTVDVSSAEASWKATYWNNPWQLGTPDFWQYEPRVDYHWDGSPAPGIDGDHFSVRWERWTYAAPGSYTFIVRADDGARLWLNDQLLIDEWETYGETLHNATVDHPGGDMHIKFDFRENTGLAVARLDWGPTGEQGGGVPPSHPQPQPPAQQPPLGNVGSATIYRVYYLNLRAQPSLDADVVTVLDTGQGVSIVGYRYGDWVMIRTADGNTGWVNGYYLYTTVQLHMLPTYTPPAGPPPPPQQPHPTPPGSGAPPPPPPQGASAVIVGQNGLNVRGGPGFDYAVVTQVYIGQEVGLPGYRDATTTWIQIYLPGGTLGWVNKGYLQTNADFSTFEVWDDDVHSAARAAVIIGASSVNVRSGPGPEYIKVTHVLDGEEVLLLGYRNGDATWVAIRTATGVTGWINANYIATDIPLSRLEIGSP